jgi:hypothetical protein
MTRFQRLIRALDLDGPANDGMFSIQKASAVLVMTAGLALALGGLVLERDSAYWPAVVLSIFGLVGVFGKKHLDGLLARLSVNIGGFGSVSSTTTKTVAHITTEEILSRRGDDGTEPAGEVPQLHDD